MAIAKSGRELGKSEKILLGIVAILSISFLYWTFLLNPELSKLEPLEKEVKVLKEQVKNTATIEKNIEKKEKELDSLKVEYEEATKVISKTDRYPELVKDIRELATSSSLKITNEILGVPTVFAQTVPESTTDNTTNSTDVVVNPAEGLKTMSVALSLEGDFNKVLEFINKLEEDKRILEVQAIVAKDKTTIVDLTYYISGGEELEEYDFNTGSYGKDNLFN